MGEVTNQPKTLEERIRAITLAAKLKNVDFDLCYVAARDEWSSNWGDGVVRSRLSDLLDLVEEDIRVNGKPDVMPEPPELPEEPEMQRVPLLY